MEYSPLFVTLMGIGTVFFGLICIIFLTMVMGAVLKGKEKAPAAAAAAPVAAPHPSRRGCSLRSWPRSLPLSPKRSVFPPAA